MCFYLAPPDPIEPHFASIKAANVFDVFEVCVFCFAKLFCM